MTQTVALQSGFSFIASNSGQNGGLARVSSLSFFSGGR